MFSRYPYRFIIKFSIKTSHPFSEKMTLDTELSDWQQTRDPSVITNNVVHPARRALLLAVLCIVL